MAPDGSLEDEAVSSPRAGDSADTTPGSRKNFTVADDLSLLRCVNLVRPWEAAVGTSNGIMRAFETIAEKCRSVPGFVKKDGPALRTRFDRLVRVFRAQQRASMRSSGTSEEYKERDVLLQDVVCRMDNWKEKSEKDKALERARKDGIESSGQLMRRLAMAEMEDEDDPSDVEEENTGEQEENSGEQEQAGAASAHAGDAGREGAVINSGQKRAAPRGNRRTHKPSKREKLSVVRDSIAQAIDGSLSEASAKYEYLRERLQFDREESVRRLAFDERRMEADRDREARRDAADKEREQANQAFMVKLLQIAMGKPNDN